MNRNAKPADFADAHVCVCEGKQRQETEKGRGKCLQCLSTCLYVNFVQENLNGGSDNDGQKKKKKKKRKLHKYSYRPELTSGLYRLMLRINLL